MKKLLLSFLAIATLLNIAFSQDNSLGKSDPEAKKILDEVSTKFKSFKAVEATFTLRIEDSKGTAQGTKKGSVYMKGTKYKITITGQEVFFDGKDKWTYDKSANEVTISKYDPAETAITPQKLFTNFYDKDYLYKLNGEQSQAGKQVQEIEMTPIDKTKSFFKIYVYVNKASKTVYSSKVLDKSGNRFIYTVNTINGNASFPDTIFSFDKSKYPGVEEVDLRN